MSRQRVLAVVMVGVSVLALALTCLMSPPITAETMAEPETTLPIGTPPTPDPDATLPLMPTDTPTPTATPTPRPVHLPMVMRQLRDLENGDFESGQFSPHWAQEGNLGSQIVSGGLPRTGRYAALMGDPRYDSAGGCPIGETRLVQVVDVPRLGHPALHVWYRIWSEDTIDFDYFAIYIADSGGSHRDRLHRDGCTLWTGNLWSSGWREAIVSLDNYRGQTVRIELVNAMTNGDGWYNTWTYVDDIRLDPGASASRR